MGLGSDQSSEQAVSVVREHFRTANLHDPASIQDGHSIVVHHRVQLVGNGDYGSIGERPGYNSVHYMRSGRVNAVSISQYSTTI